jgi:hypothetical protein
MAGGETACGSGVRNASFVALGGGATLLYASTATDTSFMRLNSTPPGGAVYAGWQVGVAVPPLGTSLTGIHNPRGDLQKISFGNLSSYASCSPSSGGMFNCSDSNAFSATFYESTWSGGLVEPGSSGSALFLDNGHYLVGQLYGGSVDNSCSDAGSDVYGVVTSPTYGARAT